MLSILPKLQWGHCNFGIFGFGSDQPHFRSSEKLPLFLHVAHNYGGGICADHDLSHRQDCDLLTALALVLLLYHYSDAGSGVVLCGSGWRSSGTRLSYLGIFVNITIVIIIANEQ